MTDESTRSREEQQDQAGKEPVSAEARSPSRKSSLGELITLFLRLGFTAFGGPAAHIAMMREEVVRRRQWMSDERFVDLIGITNLIPGPSSTELAIYLGYLRAGWPGLFVAGICFIGPAMLIVLVISWAGSSMAFNPSWSLLSLRPSGTWDARSSKEC